MTTDLSDKVVIDLTENRTFSYLDYYFKEEELAVQDRSMLKKLLRHDVAPDSNLMSKEVLKLITLVKEEYRPDYVVIDQSRACTSMMIVALKALGITPLFKTYSGEVCMNMERKTRGLEDINHLLKPDCEVSTLVLANSPALADRSNLILVDIGDDKVYV